MYCQICKTKEATIHLTEITEGVRTEMHLCEHCAQQEGIAVSSQIPINELLSNLLATQPAENDLFAHPHQEIVCPYCGMTLDQFAKEALLGCPYDYEVFEKLLAPLLEKAHDYKTVHCGKVPSRASEGTKKQIELMTLRQELETAVQNENYELAAQLRDKLAKME